MVVNIYFSSVGVNLVKTKDAKAYGSKALSYDSRASRTKLLGGSSSAGLLLFYFKIRGDLSAETTYKTIPGFFQA